MKLFIDKQTVIDILPGRKLDPSQISDADIYAAQRAYLVPWMGEEFYNYMTNNLYDFSNYINEALKYIIAYGTLKIIFSKIAVEVSDRGVFQQFAVDANPVSSKELWNEYKNSLDVIITEWITEAKKYGYEMKKLGYPNFALFPDDLEKHDSDVIYFTGTKKRINI